ncbi:MAG TPA: IS1634 family transposase [Anaerohalosphaeraceae bacterium]|mgnify:FL=1|nr:IS1634 family transposase [Anaerohalosphaeraceae bacterium]
MFIRPCYRRKNGKRHAYWALVESYRTERGPRQRIVAYLGLLRDDERRGIKQAAVGTSPFPQLRLFDAENQPEPEWVEVDAAGVRVENQLDFGGPWLALQLIRKLKLDTFLESIMPPGREEAPWSKMALVLAICRLCNPSSELHIAEHYYQSTALADLLGIPAEKVYDERLYRSLDQLLPHKEALETHLKARLGGLFNLKYDLLLYDVTSTYFEGQCRSNPKAQRGYSRDKRPDCKQVCIGLVVSKDGMPLGYEVFAGNRNDVKTWQEIVLTMEARYGKADRIWCGDRGMMSQENLEFMQTGNRKYIIGASKSTLKRFERELLEANWQQIREDLEVKLCPSPDNGDELFILCRSQDRREKEKAMHQRFEQRIETALEKLKSGCQKRRYQKETIDRKVGRILAQNSRAAGLFQVEVTPRQAGATLSWSKNETWRAWAQLHEGCYLLRTNVMDWSAEDLWQAYIQLTEAEAAFRIHKSDLKIRPVWHQKEDRVLAHILVCFLAYVLWKTLHQMTQAAGLGDEPRRIFEELGKISLVDVVLPTRKGVEIRRRCVRRPTEHQAILLTRLGLNLPWQLNSSYEM